MKFLGSKSVLAVLAAMVLTLLAVNPASSASDTGGGQETCPGDGKVELEDGGATILVEAPDGEVVTGVCLKAGSDNSKGCNGGLVNVELLEDDWAESVTFVLADYGLTCGLSHYVPEFAPTTTTTTTTSTTTTVPSTTTTSTTTTSTSTSTTTTVILSPTTTTTVPQTTTTVILPPDETEGSDASDGTPTFTG